MARRPEPRPGDILAALDELGALHHAKVSAGEAYVLCPYHGDRSIGSFSVSLDTGLNKCFACGNGGSFHRYLMAVTGMDHLRARRWCLSRLIPLTRPEHITPAAPPEVTEASLALFTAPPDEALYAKGVTAVACGELGILWNPAEQSWVFPVRDPHTGTLWGWQEKRGRFMRNHPDGIPVKSALFGWHLIPAGVKVTLVESPVDVAVMRDAEYLAVSSFGSGYSSIQLDLIADHCTGLILAFDDDPAGWKATSDILDHWKLLPVRAFNYAAAPGAKDPGEMDDEAIRWGMTHLLC